ncbi:HEPN domain-containing protein [Gemmatimonadota bacterium]
MKEMFLDLAKYRIQRAFETKKDAEILLRSHNLKDAVNRVYYANFYAIKGLLATKMQDSAKHQIVLQTFHNSFVQVGEVPKEYGLIVDRSYRSRDEGDRKEALPTVSRAEAESLLAECERFLCFTRDLLKQLVSNHPQTNQSPSSVDQDKECKGKNNSR